ncbi:hypothetical protein LdCL_170012500 [Leishmania donovani]|uniref:Uncharacterized protein n=1 Tax=Leishmania donovani TaxID=5661 RepID=A0A3S5H707_LEIDO|nr:hypothetical protein LdCL_170012250 [Leishmania donovani]AYU77830.1 hypothetical protein LdCL_170012500 [Leishmania donovani]
MRSRSTLEPPTLPCHRPPVAWREAAVDTRRRGTAPTRASQHGLCLEPSPPTRLAVPPHSRSPFVPVAAWCISRGGAGSLHRWAARAGRDVLESRWRLVDRMDGAGVLAVSGRSDATPSRVWPSASVAMRRPDFATSQALGPVTAGSGSGTWQG